MLTLCEVPEKFEIQNIPEGSLVEFKEIQKYKYGWVSGGFGCSTHTLGSAVFAVLGRDVDEVISELKNKAIVDAIQDAERELTGKLTIGKYKSYVDRTYRQPVKILGTIDYDAIKVEMAEEAEKYVYEYVFDGMRQCVP
jgi:hypothetical protein